MAQRRRWNDMPSEETMTEHPRIETVILPAEPNITLVVERAAGLLRAGQVVAFPTDTVYGVGALFSDEEAVGRIYWAKGRPETKGIPILLASALDVPLVAISNETAEILMAEFWPGPLTLVLPKRASVPAAVSKEPTVAVRVPNHGLVRTLIMATGAPLAVTSANCSGEPPTTNPAAVYEMLGGRVAAIVDGGLAPGGTPSTIVDCTGERPQILRPGPIPERLIRDAIQRGA
jgi:L-threonylcarbamoyladenylate synthase